MGKISDFISNHLRKIVIAIIVLLLISNLYYMNKASDYQSLNDKYYSSNANHFYGGMYSLEHYIDQIIKQEKDPDPVELMAYSIWARNAIEKSSRSAIHMGFAEENDIKNFGPSEVRYLFDTVLGYHANAMEASVDDDQSNVFEKAKLLEKELAIIRANLPKNDEDYEKLTPEQLTEIWVKIVDELPESEELKWYKKHYGSTWFED